MSGSVSSKARAHGAPCAIGRRWLLVAARFMAEVTMSVQADDEGTTSRRPEKKSLTADEQGFIAALLDGLSNQDPVAYEALLKSNPTLFEQSVEAQRLRERIRAALVDRSSQPLSPVEQRLVERTRALLAEHRAVAAREAGSTGSDEPIGILTSLTRMLAPDQAMDLYRKITPVLVHQVLNIIYPTVNLGVVRQLVDHLCSAEVYARLLTFEHVRDAILHELGAELGRSESCQQITREDLQEVIEQSGLMGDLVAMENCIKLAASRAS